ILESLDYDIILIETVGVGQTELQVMNLADVTGIILVPESGDVIQTLKAGIFEFADIFVINKSDRPGSEHLSSELGAMIDLDTKKKRRVLSTSALEKKGIPELATLLIDLGRE